LSFPLADLNPTRSEEQHESDNPPRIVAAMDNRCHAHGNRPYTPPPVAFDGDSKGLKQTVIVMWVDNAELLCKPQRRLHTITVGGTKGSETL
jgi:hypothetical protein